MKVIVLGAGVIGVATAYFLAKNGHEVTVLEKSSGPALGCSYANGGQLSYSHIETWASQTSLSSIIKAGIGSNPFFSIKDFSKKSSSWLWEFFKNSAAKTSQENSEKLFWLSSYSQKAMIDLLLKENSLEFNYTNQGILHFYRNEKSLNSAIKQAEFYNSIGRKAQILSAHECLRKEPTLAQIFNEKKLAGGIFFPSDASGDSFLFTKELERVCKEKLKVVFEYDVEVKNLLTNYKKITGVNTSKKVFTADKYVYCLGAQGDKLLQGIGINTRIYPLKGYSISLPVDDVASAPNIALTDPERKIVYSRIGNVFRAAGMVEMCGLNEDKNKNLIKTLRNSMSSTFSDFGNVTKVTEWSNFRPFRPNSIPLICQVKKMGNLMLNTGHGSLGWTLACGSGKILSEILAGKDDGSFKFLEEEGDSL